MDAEALKQLLLKIKIEPGDESTVTKSMSEIQELFEKKKDVTERELDGSCITRDERQLSAIIGQCTNPFSGTPSPVLYNLSTGKAATLKTQQFLLGAIQIGSRAMNEFIQRYILLKLVTVNAKEIHLVFDNITSPSIKDIERERRGESERHTSYSNLLLKQKQPTNFLQALRSDSFKLEFVKLLSNGFSDPSLSCILGDKVLFLIVGKSCFSLRKSDVVIAWLEEIDKKCSHKEADTRMITHAASINSPVTIAIRSADTDILVISLSNISKMNKNNTFYLETGLASNNTHKFTNLTHSKFLRGYVWGT
ncbi:hypothetical protein OUZ56_009817 [Daphnia magna]|uniref:Uncharacterized protein n=1 Tax=Daphnia magna TaxID=35525 RepID=A0ABR0AGY7_9CRUS|nr:hypothetical protein OUZ56_009817 [Daphnia magna]